MSTPKPDYLLAMADNVYPFDSEYSDERFNRCMSDLYLLADSDVLTNPNAYIHSMQLESNGAVSAIVLGSSAGGGEFFNSESSNVEESEHAAFGAYAVSAWTTSDLRLTVVTDKDYVAEEFSTGTSFSGPLPPISIRNLDIRPKRVTSLFFDDGAINSYTETAVLRAGYNIRFTKINDILEDDFREVTRIRIDSGPGLGEGKYEADCDNSSNLVLRSINGRTADEFGNFILNPVDCYWAAYRGTDTDIAEEESAAADTIVINGDCTVCFSCDEVEQAYRNLMTMFERGKAVRIRLCHAIEVFRDYVSLLDAFKEELDTTRFSFTVEQTDGRMFDLIFRLQAGGKLNASGEKMGIKGVSVTVTYGDGDTIPYYTEYSGRKKIPGRYPEVFNFAPGDGFTESNRIGPNQYAYWYWNMLFDRDDPDTNGTEVSISVDYTLTYDDDSTLTGSFSRTVDIVPLESSS